MCIANTSRDLGGHPEITLGQFSFELMTMMAMVRTHDPFIVLPMHKRHRKGSQAAGAEAVHGSSCDEDAVQLFFMFFYIGQK